MKMKPNFSEDPVNGDIFDSHGNCIDLSGDSLLEVFSKISDDAFKAGMQEAAAICHDKIGYGPDGDWSAEDCEKAIGEYIKENL